MVIGAAAETSRNEMPKKLLGPIKIASHLQTTDHNPHLDVFALRKQFYRSFVVLRDKVDSSANVESKPRSDCFIASEICRTNQRFCAEDTSAENRCRVLQSLACCYQMMFLVR